MNLTNQHKALLLTFLISGTIMLSIFNLSLKQHDENISESYYEMEPEKELTEEDAKLLEALEKLNASKAETNKAFNETQDNKHFAQAYKLIAPPEDYVPKHSSTADNNEALKKAYEITDESKVNEAEISSFDKVNDLLKKQKQDGDNSKSTISYSLVNRTKIHIPIPIYLCEVNGKIIINITVNDKGSVVDTYVNTASNSTNECLIEHALDYAKRSQFNTDPSKKSQIGSITFYFIGKH